MANEDFTKVIFKDVEFKYPRLGDTFRFNTGTRQSEPCAPTASGAAWTINWEMAYDKAKPIYDQLKAHYDSRHASGRVKAPFHTIFGMKKLDNGNVEFRAKRNGTKGSGEVNKPPMVIGADKQPLADVNIWGGSKGTVRCWAAPVTDPDGKGGISLFFDAVQVTEAVYGGGGLDDFDAVAVEAPADDPFGAPAHQAAPKPTPLDDLGGDDVPF